MRRLLLLCALTWLMGGVGWALPWSRTEAAALAKPLRQASQPRTDVEAVRQKVRQVLARAEFGDAGEGGEDWLKRWLQRLHEWLSTTHEGGGLGTLVTSMQYVLAIALLIVVGFTLRAWLQPTTTSRPVASAAEAASSARPKRSIEWWQAAQRAAAAGDFRTAVRLAFGGVLAGLYEQADVRLDERLTHGEMVRQLRDGGHEPQSRVLAEARRVYEPVWYGQVPARSQDWDSMQRFRTSDVAP